MNSEDFFNQWVKTKWGISIEVFRQRVGDRFVDEIEDAFFSGFNCGMDLQKLADTLLR